MARPRKYSDEQVQDIKEKLADYIENTDIPILAEFAYINNVLRQVLYEYDEFTTLIKRAVAKKEAQLERMALTGDVDKTMAIFSLKQLGWRDKQEIEHSGGINIVNDVEELKHL